MAIKEQNTCPHCKRPEAKKPDNYDDLPIAEQEKIKALMHDTRINLYAIVDKNQRMEKSVPEYLCFSCANDMLSTLTSHEEIAIVS